MKIHTIRVTIYLVFLMIAMFLSLGSQAAPSERYQATVPVAGYSSSDYNKALVPALTEVLAKLSGNPDIANLPSIQRALEKPGKFVQSYNYSSTTENGSKKLFLVVRFLPRLIDRLLGESNQHIFTKENPQTLVWLVEKKPDGQYEVINSASNPVVAALNASSKQQRVALLWPMMDLQDISAVSPDQIRQLNEIVASYASRRYEPDAVLMGKIEQNSAGKWQGDWKWFKGMSAQKTWQTTGIDPAGAAVAVLSYLTGVSQAEAFSSSTLSSLPMPGESSVWVDIKVSGINGLRDYANVVRYLKKLRFVTMVKAQQLQGESAILSVQVNGGKEFLINELSAGDRLVQDMYGSPNESMLLYHWNANASQAVVDRQNIYRDAGSTAQSFPSAQPEVNFGPPMDVPFKGDDMVDGE